MKTKLLKIIALSCVITTSFAQNNLVLEGQYLGKNVLVKNSFGPGGVGYCVSEVKVNGKATKDKINADIFQIDLPQAGLKQGEKVKLEIVCKNGCTPRVAPLILNPGALGNTSLVLEGTFKWQNIFIANTDNTTGVNEVVVNGKSVASKVTSTIYEVDLMSMGLNNGDKVKIEFRYSRGHDPLVINPEALN
jgi:hypothetical protein